MSARAAHNAEAATAAAASKSLHLCLLTNVSELPKVNMVYGLRTQPGGRPINLCKCEGRYHPMAAIC